MSAAVVAPFAESLRASLQPCTFLLIVPVVTAVVAARASWRALAVSIVAVVTGGLVLVDNRLILTGWALRLSAAVVAVLLVWLVLPRRISEGSRDGERRVWADAGVVGVVCLTATMWWRPCVGIELGAILNGGQNGLIGQVVPMSAYMMGAMVPVAIIVAIGYATEPSRQLLSVAATVSAVLGGLVAVSIVAGQHDEVVVMLTRWTLN